LGEIVFWTIVRTAVTIPGLWILRFHIDEKLWWMISIAAIYVLIIHPAFVGYRWFEERNKNVINATLCSSCKHFNASAVLCMKYDKHPTENYIPCEGEEWEPKS
jgi:hypothetical protein